MIFGFNLQDQQLQEMIYDMDGIINVQFVFQQKIVFNKIDEFHEKLDTFKEDYIEKMLINDGSANKSLSKDAHIYNLGPKNSRALLH